MLFHLPGRRTVNLLCARLIQGRETSYGRQTAASSLPSRSHVGKLLHDAPAYAVEPRKLWEVPDLWDVAASVTVSVCPSSQCRSNAGLFAWRQSQYLIMLQSDFTYCLFILRVNIRSRVWKSAPSSGEVVECNQSGPSLWKHTGELWCLSLNI